MKKENVIGAVKIVGSVAVSIGIGAVAGNIIMVTTPANTGKIAKACIKVGGYAISGIASTEAGKQFGKKVDLITNMVDNFTEKLKKEETEKKEFDVKPEDVEGGQEDE